MNKHFPWIPDILEALPQFLTRPVMPPGLIDMLELFDVSLPNSQFTPLTKTKLESPRGID